MMICFLLRPSPPVTNFLRRRRSDGHLAAAPTTTSPTVPSNQMKTVTAAFVSHQPGFSLINSFRPPISAWKFNKTQTKIVKVPGAPLQHSFCTHRRVKCAWAGRSGHQGSYSGDRSEEEPFWLSLTKDVVGSLRSVAVFLTEQPSQLKYIEWPSFQNTLKTATLTLILVAVLIVALSSIDSSLSYILALLLRKAA